MRKNHYMYALLFVIVIGVIPFLASLASAESYIGGQLGFTIPESLGGVSQTGGGARFSNLDLNNSFTYGAKAGHYFERYKWLGVEADLYTTNPHLENQNATRTTAGGSTSVIVPGALNRVTTLAFSLMARYPGERFQPYAGMGMGVYFAKAAGSFSKDTDASPGFHLVGGSRFFVTKEVALFGEYKYDHATFSFPSLPTGIGTGLTGDYMAHTLVVGVSYHFMPEGR